MRHLGNRTIKLKKDKLIEKIKENKENHIKEYERAIIAYREEALKQLEQLKNEVTEGKLDISLNLIIPVNNSENYDKIIEMFEWEVEKEVELSQNEFVEYVQDETNFALEARLSNSAYFNR